MKWQILEQNWGGAKNGDDLIDRTVYQWSEESKSMEGGNITKTSVWTKHSPKSVRMHAADPNVDFMN